MKLVIDYSLVNGDEKFIQYLIKLMQTLYIKYLDAKRLSSWDEYLNSGIIKSIGNRKIYCKNIIVSGFSSLRYEKYNNREFIISIDQSAVFPSTFVKTISLVKLIDNGNTERKAYPIFTKVFKYIENNLEVLYKSYRENIL